MPVNVQLPAPDFVKVPILEIIPETVASPVPPKIAAVVSVMAPDAVAALALLFTKEPLIANGSAVVKPFKSTKAFNAIVVAVVVPKAALFPNFNVPVLTDAVLLNVLTPLNIQVPVPDFVNVPEPLITPDAVARPAPAPPKIAAVVSMISPDAVAAVALLFTKEPLSVMGSAVVEPFKSRVAPDATVVEADVLPKAPLLPTVNVPVLTVVVPTYVFAPDKVSASVPFFTRETVPLPSLITPEKIVLVLLAPAVSVTSPATELVILPAPVMDPTARLNPFKSRVPVMVMVMALFATGPNTVVAAPTLIDPAEIVVELV